MNEDAETYVYELIDITFELPYEQPEADSMCHVSEDGAVTDHDSLQIEYDADGVPMGASIEEIKNVKLS